MCRGADACVSVTPQCGRHTAKSMTGGSAAKVAVTLDESRDLCAAVSLRVSVSRLTADRASAGGPVVTSWGLRAKARYEDNERTHPRRSGGDSRRTANLADRPADCHRGAMPRRRSCIRSRHHRAAGCRRRRTGFRRLASFETWRAFCRGVRGQLSGEQRFRHEHPRRCW